MKITLATSGGFAAGISIGREPESVDTAGLSPEAGRELEALVQAARSAPPVVQRTAGRAGDAMSYTITLPDDDPPTVLQESDVAMTDEFADLLEWLQARLRQA